MDFGKLLIIQRILQLMKEKFRNFCYVEIELLATIVLSGTHAVILDWTRSWRPCWRIISRRKHGVIHWESYDLKLKDGRSLQKHIKATEIWMYKRKQDVDGNLKRYKARSVAQGYNQEFGEDYKGTTSTVVRFESVRTFIGLAVKNGLNLHQLDIETARWTQGNDIHESTWRNRDPWRRAFGWKLKKSIYGLKQCSRCWNEALGKHLKSMNLKK